MADEANKAAARAQITQGALKFVLSSAYHFAPPLTTHSAIFNDPATLERQFPVPVCQCVQIKALSSNTEGGAERYRVVLSDITNFVQSMLATRKMRVVAWVD